MDGSTEVLFAEGHPTEGSCTDFLAPGSSMIHARVQEKTKRRSANGKGRTANGK
jgi:hypothetical protein